MDKDTENEIKSVVKAGSPVKPMVPAPMQTLHEKSHGPPVFIKFERYGELLGDIQKLRSYSLGLRDAIDAMAEIEKEFKVAMGLTNKVLDKVNMLLSSIDMKLMKKSSETAVEVVKTPPEIEDYIKGIYDQIDRLKGELSGIE